MSPRVLIVEPAAAIIASLQQAVGDLVDIDVDTCSSFEAARRLLVRERYDWLVTNLRLHGFNGLHLVYLAPHHTSSIVYTNQCEIAFAREVQKAGAFYEWGTRLRHALGGYLQAADAPAGTLPGVDRRTPGLETRRSICRGGRRRSDSN